MDVCNHDSKKSKPTRFEPHALMKHLEKIGGDYTYTDRSSGTREQKYVGMECVFHYATFKFLHVLFGDYYKSKFELFHLIFVQPFDALLIL